MVHSKEHCVCLSVCIRFSFKVGKNAAGTFEMLQGAFGKQAVCMKRVFE
jgi:hypothetical protein